MNIDVVFVYSNDDDVLAQMVNGTIFFCLLFDRVGVGIVCALIPIQHFQTWDRLFDMPDYFILWLLEG